MTGACFQTRLNLGESHQIPARLHVFDTVVQSSLRLLSPKHVHQDYEDCRGRRVSHFLRQSLFLVGQSQSQKVRLFLLESWCLVYDY